MDQETVIALCAIFTVVIGIIELTRKRGTVSKRKKNRGTLRK